MHLGRGVWRSGSRTRTPPHTTGSPAPPPRTQRGSPLSLSPVLRSLSPPGPNWARPRHAMYAAWARHVDLDPGWTGEARSDGLPIGSPMSLDGLVEAAKSMQRRLRASPPLPVTAVTPKGKARATAAATADAHHGAPPPAPAQQAAPTATTPTPTATPAPPPPPPTAAPLAPTSPAAAPSPQSTPASRPKSAPATATSASALRSVAASQFAEEMSAAVKFARGRQEVELVDAFQALWWLSTRMCAAGPSVHLPSVTPLFKKKRISIKAWIQKKKPRKKKTKGNQILTPRPRPRHPLTLFAPRDQTHPATGLPGNRS